MSDFKCTLWPSGEVLEVNSEESLLSQLKKAGKKIKSSCGGCASCGDCVVVIKSGELNAEAGKLTAGKFAMDMTSIKVLDLTDTEMNGKLTGHLNSDDFFATAKSPESTFEIVSVEPIAGAAAGAANYNVKGNLTIKGIAKAITFPATITMDEKELKANASFDIDRTEWDIKYGSGKFFQDLGDKMINDAFTVKFNIVAKA
jgi:hypothetical protein